MPELPEVETVVRELRPYLENRTIVRAHVDWPRAIAAPLEDIPTFVNGVVGNQIEGIKRRGKFIVIALERKAQQQVLIVHLRMSGRLMLSPLGSLSHLRAEFHLDDNGMLYFYNPRRFGRLWLTNNPQAVLGHLGPEPLSDDFTAEVLMTRLEKRRGMLKPLLLDQHFIAGLGNIYVDESLFLARLHPQRTADTLQAEDVDRLHTAIQTVLNQALAHHGTSFDAVFVRPEGERGRQQEGLRVYQQTGLPCTVCGQAIERTVVGGRGTHFCPQCQRLARRRNFQSRTASLQTRPSQVRE